MTLVRVPVTSDPQRLRLLKRSSASHFQNLAQLREVEVIAGSAESYGVDRANGSYTVLVRISGRDHRIARQFLGLLTEDHCGMLGMRDDPFAIALATSMKKHARVAAKKTAHNTTRAARS